MCGTLFQQIMLTFCLLLHLNRRSSTLTYDVVFIVLLSICFSGLLSVSLVAYYLVHICFHVYEIYEAISSCVSRTFYICVFNCENEDNEHMETQLHIIIACAYFSTRYRDSVITLLRTPASSP